MSDLGATLLEYELVTIVQLRNILIGQLVVYAIKPLMDIALIPGVRTERSRRSNERRVPQRVWRHALHEWRGACISVEPRLHVCVLHT